MLEPQIIELPEKKFVGYKIKTTLSANETKKLWREFMPQRKQIKNTVNNRLFSIQIFDQTPSLENFTPDTVFEKWAAMEVSSFEEQPDTLGTHILKGGLYAVFIHKGTFDSFSITLQSIFEHWLPNSSYQLDQREHFEIMDEDYHPNDPNAEEEVWIPIKTIAVSIFF